MSSRRKFTVSVLALMRVMVACIAAITPMLAQGVTYRCDVAAVTNPKPDGKVDLLDPDVLQRRQQHAIIEDETEPSVQRCSFTPSVGRVTCDRYEVDRVEIDRNVSLKKFYLFRAQFDIQLFSDLSFIENNGRGGLAYGKCKVTRP